MAALPHPERPVNVDQQDRTLLMGVFSVRKGKTQLHKWAERQVILCGTCLMVASVKDSLAGKMHILPLVGGKVRLSQCVALSFTAPKPSFFSTFLTRQCTRRSPAECSRCISTAWWERPLQWFISAGSWFYRSAVTAGIHEC